MERELESLALRLRPGLMQINPAPADTISKRVYLLRRSTLIRGVALAPVIAGCLLLSGTVGLSMASMRNLPVRPTTEAVAPANAETIWERELKPVSGIPFHLTLDLQNRLTATTPRRHQVLWQLQLPLISASSAPVILEEGGQLHIAIATAQGAVYLVSATDGHVSWMQNVSDRIDVSPLPVKNSVLAVACADGKIYGLNSADGQIEYMIQTGSPITALEPVTDGSGEHVYAVADGRRVMALNARTGDLQWRRDTFGVVSDSPVVAANTVITPSFEGNDVRFWGFDTSGELKWMNTFDRYQALAAGDEYIALSQGTLVTLIRAATGEPVHYWQLKESPALLALARQGNQVVVRADQELLVSALN